MRRVSGEEGGLGPLTVTLPTRTDLVSDCDGLEDATTAATWGTWKTVWLRLRFDAGHPSATEGPWPRRRSIGAIPLPIPDEGTPDALPTSP